ncbi:putative small nuclear RNA gene activation protein (SNAP) 50 [Trypanosoma rangeli]|uniref:Putative small nuclear RNA gene activation protein (SNAP) 50 n=1 Tax=Trypanosoma rangeli TaxID=5698 RepID=A0A3R7KX62_TRYRA|nr:putative small nuclear RNA gene activation protein (SNAP) 50 [Trypanosoma rangeli]RNF11471.1 putative small nuclear RNA gene activation protein (SNAP) 50 [Trypanosoma rangeli]|eukprot:RNF11471.1 putative small nuclear RNA gene activation protein (SNAP) 50 [Trypanosoma rangeli]
MPSKTALDPFAIVIDAANQASLAAISAQTAISISDLRQLNPALGSYTHLELLPLGTVVHLPPRLEQRGKPYGNYFTIGPMEEALRSLDARLDELVAKEQTQLPALPPRKILSKTERIIEMVRKEGERQLARIKEEYAECGERSTVFQFLVDVEPVKQLQSDIEDEFDGGKLHLKALESANHATFNKAWQHQENALTEASRWSVRDASEDFCLEEHSHRWEFTFLSPDAALEAHDTWAVLSCQTLGALIDAFECRNCLPVNISKNAFVFIGGTFYIDNRHAGIEGENYDDLTAPIRHFQPIGDGDSGNMNAVAFGRCPVKYMSETTFADLDLRLGEFGVIRHIGWCNHYFYLSSVASLRGLERHDREKGAYPQRVMRAPRRAVRCRMCRHFPATIVCYKDELSPSSPCPYCVPCFELLHATDEGVVEEDKCIVIKHHDGKYFSS